VRRCSLLTFAPRLWFVELALDSSQFFWRTSCWIRRTEPQGAEEARRIYPASLISQSGSTRSFFFLLLLDMWHCERAYKRDDVRFKSRAGMTEESMDTGKERKKIAQISHKELAPTCSKSLNKKQGRLLKWYYLWMYC